MTAPDQSAPVKRRLLGRKAETWVLIFVALLPLAAIVRLVGDYGVNVPYGDEWSLLPLFAKCHDHQLTFADLFRQHNEHRIFFPKLLFLAFARWTHWNVQAEMFFSVLLACGASAGIYFLLQRTVPGTSRQRFLLWALINLLIFAPVQAENWLWGFQLQVFIPNLCLIGCLVLLTSTLPEAVKFAGASLLTIVATFSFAGGLLLWPVIAFYFFLKSTRARWLIAWTAAFVFSMLIYFVGYKRQPVLGPEFGNPFDYLVYFVEFLGIALNRSSLSTGAAITGGLIGATAFLLYLIACWFFWKSPAASRRAAAPWLVLGAYVICSAALAAHTRISVGPQQALNSRYATISLNLYVGLIGLVAIAAQSARAGELRPKVARAVASLEPQVFAAILTLSAVSFPAAIDHMEILRRLRLEGAAHLQFSQVINPTEKLPIDLMIGATLPAIAQNADLLDRLRLLDLPLRRSAVLRDAEDRAQRSTPEFGRTDGLMQKDGDLLEMHGWSFLPERGRPAPCVVLAFKSGEDWTAFALSDLRELRDDVAKEMKSRKYLASGWRAFIHRKLLPTEATRLSAWDFDPATGGVYKLPGDFILPAR